jgi:protein TonB
VAEPVPVARESTPIQTVTESRPQTPASAPGTRAGEGGSGATTGATSTRTDAHATAAGREPSPAAMAPDLPAIPLAYGVNPAPTYPASARRRGIEGEVVLEVWVDESGQATRLLVRAASGHAGLDRAALDAVARWRFRPAQKQGKAVAAVALVPVRFRLTD